MRVLLASVTEEPLDLAMLEELVRRVDAGAVVTFTGRVRDHDCGRSVALLDYSGHPTAMSVLAAVAAEIAALPGVLAVGVSHRLGALQVGEAAIVAAVSAAHRDVAFAACGRLVDEVKARLPVWKRQVFTDGSTEWVGSC